MTVPRWRIGRSVQKNWTARSSKYFTDLEEESLVLAYHILAIYAEDTVDYTNVEVDPRSINHRRDTALPCP